MMTVNSNTNSKELTTNNILKGEKNMNDNMQISEQWPVRSKIAAGVLAIIFGNIGVHKFYLGKIGMGILYLVFCWTFIPAVVGIIEGIIYLCTDDETFQIKHKVRIQK